jgi:hypothetical protein
VRALLSDSGFTTLHPAEEWQTTGLTIRAALGFQLDRNFYVDAKPVPLRQARR